MTLMCLRPDFDTRDQPAKARVDADLVTLPALGILLIKGNRDGRRWPSNRVICAYRYCRQVGSFARAQALLRQGHTYLDRSGDGVACESLR